jgi:hypothetical protein
LRENYVPFVGVTWVVEQVLNVGSTYALGRAEKRPKKRFRSRNGHFSSPDAFFQTTRSFAK